jgi:hypothetical protein
MRSVPRMLMLCLEEAGIQVCRGVRRRVAAPAGSQLPAKLRQQTEARGGEARCCCCCCFGMRSTSFEPLSLMVPPCSCVIIAQPLTAYTVAPVAMQLACVRLAHSHCEVAGLSSSTMSGTLLWTQKDKAIAAAYVCRALDADGFAGECRHVSTALAGQSG